MRSFWVVLCSALCVVALGSADTRAAFERDETVHFRHRGNADPRTEGWTAGGFAPGVSDGAGSAGALHWFVDDNSAASGGFGSLRVDPTPQLLAAESGWRLRLRLRVDHGGAATGPTAAVAVEYSSGLERYSLTFGTNASGQTTVQLAGTAGIAIVGEGSQFHTLEMVSDNGLNVDVRSGGATLLSGGGIAAGGVAPRLIWGSLDSANTGRGEFALLEWSTPVRQLTSNGVIDGNPEISSPWVVWESGSAATTEIMALDLRESDAAGAAIQLSNVPGRVNFSTQVDGNYALWVSAGGGVSDVFAYDLREPPSPTNPTRLTTDALVSFVRLSGTWAAWSDDGDMFAYDLSLPPSPTNPLRLTDSSEDDDFFSTDGVRVAWRSLPDGEDREIQVYDLTLPPSATNPIAITDDDFEDFDPQVEGPWVVWNRNNNTGGSTFLAYDLRLPPSPTNPLLLADGSFTAAPELGGGRAFWIETGVVARELDAPLSASNPISLPSGSFTANVRPGEERVAWIDSPSGVAGGFDVFAFDFGEPLGADNPIRVSDNQFTDFSVELDDERIVWSGGVSAATEVFVAPEPAGPGWVALWALSAFATSACRRRTHH